MLTLWIVRKSSFVLRVPQLRKISKCTLISTANVSKEKGGTRKLSPLQTEV